MAINRSGDPLQDLINQSLGIAPQPAPVAPLEQQQPPIDLSGQPVPVDVGPTTGLWEAQQAIIEGSQGTPVPEETPEAPAPLPAAPEPAAEPVAPAPPPTTAELYQEQAARGAQAGEDFSTALSDEQAALQASKQATSDQAAVQSSLEAEQARNDAEIAQAAADAERGSVAKYQTQLSKLQARETEIANTPLDSERLWKSKSAPQQIAGLFAAFASGFMSPYSGGRNFFLESFEKQVDRDIEMQRADRQSKLKALGNQKLGLKDQLNFDRQQDIYDLGTKKAMLNSGLNKLRGIQTQLQGTTQAAAVDQQIAQLEQKAAGLEEQQALKLQDHYGDMLNKEQQLAFDRTKLAQQERLAMAKKSRGGRGKGPSTPVVGGLADSTERVYDPLRNTWIDPNDFKPGTPESDRFDDRVLMGGYTLTNKATGEGARRLHLPQKVTEKLRTEIDQASEAVAGISRLQQHMDDKGLDFSATIGSLSGEKAALIKAEWTQLAMKLKNSYGLGVLTGPDMDLIEASTGGVAGNLTEEILGKVSLNHVKTVIENLAGGQSEAVSNAVLRNSGLDPNKFSISLDPVRAGRDIKQRKAAKAKVKEKAIVGDVVANVLAHNKSDKKDRASYKRSRNDANAHLRKLDKEIRQAWKRGIDTDESEDQRVGQFDAKDVDKAISSFNDIINKTSDPAVKGLAFTLKANLDKDLKKLRSETEDPYKKLTSELEKAIPWMKK